MALRKKTIEITNKDDDVLFIDEDNVIAKKRLIKNDLTKIINDLNSIEKHYKALRDHKSTKGKWQDLAKECVKKSNTYEKKMRNDKTSIEDAIDDAIQQYALSQIKELRAIHSDVASIDVGQ